MAARALILAAGRGERMRPLTDHTPKPLLEVHGRALIEWHLDALARAGIDEVVINTAWLEEAFPRRLGDGTRYGLAIRYSAEGRDHGRALETAGAIATARGLLADVFWLVSGDIWCPGFVFDPAALQAFAAGDDDARLWVVGNPAFKPVGDFALAQGRLRRPADPAARDVTYANLALVRTRLVDGIAPGTHAPLAPLLFRSADAGKLAGTRWEGGWENVGTPAQLAALAAGGAPVTAP